jgi:hypothetical protein
VRFSLAWVDLTFRGVCAVTAAERDVPMAQELASLWAAEPIFGTECPAPSPSFEVNFYFKNV